MTCELWECCQFFEDNMEHLPKTAAYIKKKLCFGAHERCNRFKIYKEFGRESLPDYLDPNDLAEVEKVMQCLRSKKQSLE